MKTLLSVWIIAFIAPNPLNEFEGTEKTEAVVDPRSSHQVHALVTSIVRENLPHKYENNKDWGKTKKMWDGLHIRRRGLRIYTKRRWKQANHGAWKKYSVRLLNPDKEFRILVQNIRPAKTGGPKIGWAFDVVCLAELRLFGRYSLWRHDVQIFSLSAEADAKVRLMASCTLAIHISKEFPPTVVLDPRVADADITLRSFRLRNISRVGGEAAQQLGRGLKKFLDEAIEKKQGKLVERMNRQIDRHRDDLEISLGEVLRSKWSRLLQSATVKDTTVGTKPSSSGP